MHPNLLMCYDANCACPGDGGAVRCGRWSFFPKLPVSRESRENRLQLRCGNASQTRTAPNLFWRGQSQLERVLQRRRGRGQRAGARRSPRPIHKSPIERRPRGRGLSWRFGLWNFAICARRAQCGVRTSAPEGSRVSSRTLRATNRENFIAKMKRESGAAAGDGGWSCSCLRSRHP